MTVYEARSFTYWPLVNSPENADDVRGYGRDPAMLSPEAVLVINVERDIVAATLDSIDEFNARYRPLEG